MKPGKNKPGSFALPVLLKDIYPIKRKHIFNPNPIQHFLIKGPTVKSSFSASFKLFSLVVPQRVPSDPFIRNK